MAIASNIRLFGPAEIELFQIFPTICCVWKKNDGAMKARCVSENW